MKKNLKAFLLMDVMVGMVISSLVMLSGMWIYFRVNNQFRHYKSLKSNLFNYHIFYSALSEDISKSKFCYYENESILLQNEKTNIKYKFENNYVLRTVLEKSDTMKVETRDFSFIQANNFFDIEKQLVEEFAFDIKLYNATHHLVFKKNYSAEDLLNEGVYR